MREQLINYVELLFAGSPNNDDIRQEILQNTLDRYDDLVSQGKTPEAAYSLAISGIGDISEIFGQSASEAPRPASHKSTPSPDPEAKKKRAAAIAMYIACPIPLFVLSELGYATLGLCMLLLLVASATALLITAGKEERTGNENVIDDSPQSELRKKIAAGMRIATLVTFFTVSFVSGAWHITWLIFPIGAAVRGLCFAILDLKEDKRNEA